MQKRGFFQLVNSDRRVAVFTEMQFVDAGHHGTRRGLHYWIHKIMAIPAGTPEQLSFAFKSAAFTEYESCVDGIADTVPAGKHEFTGESELLAAVIQRNRREIKDGWNFIHVRGRVAPGEWSPVAHRKFFLDTTGPRVVSTEPADGGTTESQTIRLQLADDNGVDLAGVRMRVNAQDVTPFLELNAASKKSLSSHDALNCRTSFRARFALWKVSLTGTQRPVRQPAWLDRMSFEVSASAARVPAPGS